MQLRGDRFEVWSGYIFSPSVQYLNKNQNSVWRGIIALTYEKSAGQWQGSGASVKRTENEDQGKLPGAVPSLAQYGG